MRPQQRNSPVPQLRMHKHYAHASPAPQVLHNGRDGRVDEVDAALERQRVQQRHVHVVHGLQAALEHGAPRGLLRQRRQAVEEVCVGLVDTRALRLEVVAVVLGVEEAVLARQRAAARIAAQHVVACGVELRRLGAACRRRPRAVTVALPHGTRVDTVSAQCRCYRAQHPPCALGRRLDNVADNRSAVAPRHTRW